MNDTYDWAPDLDRLRPGAWAAWASATPTGRPQSGSEAVRAIRAAYDLGYTMFDTAETYGTAADPHENEKLVGEALRDVRDKVQIVTKFGIRFDETSTAVNKPLIPDSRPETIRASVEGSLRRLQTDHIDLYFQHRMDPEVEPEAVAQVMADLIREGKITHWGISEANGGLSAPGPCRVPGDGGAEPLLHDGPAARGPVPGAGGAARGLCGLLPHGQRPAHRPATERTPSSTPSWTTAAPCPSSRRRRRSRTGSCCRLLRNLAEQKQATPAQISLAWMLCKKPYIVPIPGSRKVERMRENAGAAEVILSPGGGGRPWTRFWRPSPCPPCSAAPRSKADNSSFRHRIRKDERP